MPNRYCECGLYAWHDLDHLLRPGAEDGDLVLGAVAGAGKLQIQSRGFRAERAQVIGLLAGSNRDLAELLGLRYQVPVFNNNEDLSAYALQKALPVPDDLKPRNFKPGDSNHAAERLQNSSGRVITDARKLLKHYRFAEATLERFVFGVDEDNYTIRIPFTAQGDPSPALSSAVFQTSIYSAACCSVCGVGNTRLQLMKKYKEFHQFGQKPAFDWLRCCHCQADSESAAIGWLMNPRLLLSPYVFKHRPDYQYPPLFNLPDALHELHDSDCLYLTSSPLNAALLWQQGFKSVIAYSPSAFNDLAAAQARLALHSAKRAQKKLCYVEPFSGPDQEVASVLNGQEQAWSCSLGTLLGFVVDFEIGLTAPVEAEY